MARKNKRGIGRLGFEFHKGGANGYDIVLVRYAQLMKHFGVPFLEIRTPVAEAGKINIPHGPVKAYE